MSRPPIMTITLLLAVSWAGIATAQTTLSAQLLGTGHYEREDAPPPCASDPAFIVGQYDEVVQLQVGGDSPGCDSEWGAFAEFDFAGIGTDNTVLSATLVLRYTGYGDDAMGLPYVGIYDYAYTGSPVVLTRDDMDEYNALAVFAPTSATNVDITIDVTNHIADLVGQEVFQAGFFVCGPFNEVGYNDMVFFGGADHLHAPRLEIETLNPVAAEATSWSGIKAIFR